MKSVFWSLRSKSRSYPSVSRSQGPSQPKQWIRTSEWCSQGRVGWWVRSSVSSMSAVWLKRSTRSRVVSAGVYHVRDLPCHQVTLGTVPSSRGTSLWRSLQARRSLWSGFDASSSVVDVSRSRNTHRSSREWPSANCILPQSALEKSGSTSPLLYRQTG